MSFNTMLTCSPTSSTGSSSDLDTEEHNSKKPYGSFQHSRAVKEITEGKKTGALESQEATQVENLEVLLSLLKKHHRRCE
ncbi:hypothetical protein AKJ16_DCAP25004 [Drosera capensis]